MILTNDLFNIRRVSSLNMDHRHNSLDIAASEVKLATFDALAPRLSAP